MSVPWKPRHVVYAVLIEGAPATVAVDCGALDHGPVESHPVRLTATVAVQRPDPQGLPSRGERADLLRFEGRLCQQLQHAADGWFIGRWYTGGQATFVFQVLPERHAAFDTKHGWEPYSLNLTAHDDPDWLFLREWLAPTAQEEQRYASLALLSKLTQLGDDNELPREIDHAAAFDNRANALAAAEDLRRAGYVTELPTAGDRDPLVMRFRRTDRPAEFDTFIDEITAILDAHNGRYDGWGAPIVHSP